MKNDIVEDINGYKHTLTNEIARGGQGAVYRTQNPNIAVKIEFDKENMEYSGNVSGNKKFDFLRTLPLPKNINITLPQVTLRKYAGYTMTLLDEMVSFDSAFAYNFHFKPEYTNEWLDSFREGNEKCADDFAQYIKTGGIRRRLEAYFKCAVILAMLHASGLVYCDLSANNIFISRETSKAVWLIDADNINFQKCTVKDGGYYTPGYAAPEILRGGGSTFYSDCYSFAVSLFWNLTWNHPFEGVMLEGGGFDDEFIDDAQDRAYSGEYPWIFDTGDDSNRLGENAGGMPAEMVVSPRLMKYFDRTFCAEGKKKRQTRPTMFEWMNVLAETMDYTIRCPECGMDYIAEDSDSCPWCCPWPGQKKVEITVIKLVTYKNGNVFWKYKHEITEKENVQIPLRIIEGVKSSNINKIGFCIRKNEQGYAIFDLNEEYDFKVETENGKSFSVYGEVTIQQTCKIIAVHSRTHSESTIEVVIRDEIN